MTTIDELYHKYKLSSGVCIDSRKVENQNIFFCIKGDNFDGHEFAEESLKNAKTRLRTLTEAPKVAEVETVSKNFNKEPTRLADDQNNVRDFDVPNEAAYKNQAFNLEGTMFDVSTSSAIKTEAGTGAAAKTSPRVELDNFQDLSLASQKTARAPT